MKNKRHNQCAESIANARVLATVFATLLSLLATDVRGQSGMVDDESASPATPPVVSLGDLPLDQQSLFPSHPNRSLADAKKQGNPIADQSSALILNDTTPEGILVQEANEFSPSDSSSLLLDDSSAIEIAEFDDTKIEVICDCGECDECEEAAKVRFGDWLGYNSPQSDTSWMFGDGDDLGIFSLQSYPNLKIGKDSAFAFGTGIHWLNGPIATDLPPRLFDFVFAFQERRAFGENLVFDWRVSVGAFSDFEGSARKGIRFPGHAVSYYQWDPRFVSVFGVEALDRDDFSILPVGGFVWRPSSDLVIEAVFPRPKIHRKLKNGNSIYLAGELGGGTWAIERVGGINDNATYRDLRLMIGLQDFDDSDESAFEFGWAFSRKLEYRSGLGNYRPDDAFLIRWRSHY